MSDIWIGPWANFPHYMDPTFVQKCTRSQNHLVSCIVKFYLHSAFSIFTPWASYGQGVGAWITVTFDTTYEIVKLQLMQREVAELFSQLKVLYSDNTVQYVS